MKITILACFILVNFNLHAQDTAASNANNVHHDDSIEARFPGGQDAWRTFLETHMHPGVAAKHKAPAGKYTVTISFLVDKEGKYHRCRFYKTPVMVLLMMY